MKKIDDLEVKKAVKEIKLLFPEITLPENITKWWIVHYIRIKNLVEEYALSKYKTQILEIGIGHGIIANILSFYPSFSIFATEHPSREYLWREEFLNFFRRKRINIVAHDLNESIPFKNESFDIVLFCDVIEHLSPEKIPEVIKEIHRILKPEGLLFISTPNLARLENRIKLLFGKSPNPYLPIPTVGKTLGHIREFTAKEIISLIHPQFKVLKIYYGLLPVFEGKFGKKEKLLLLLKRGIPAFQDEIYIIAKTLKLKT